MKKIVFFVLVCVSMFMLVSNVCAADNGTYIIKEDGLKVESKSGVDLDNLINGNSSKDEIVLDDDYIFNLSKDSVNTGIKINRSISIDGQGHTIDGINTYRIFDITANYVVLKNIRFVNSSYLSTSINAIMCKKSTGISIINSTFINCGNSYSSGAISFEDSSSVSIINSTFIGNNGGNGGAVYFGNFSYGLIINSTFINNSGIDGGSILFGSNSYGNIINSSFYQNNCTINKCKSGGAIKFVSDNSTVNGCIFIDNEADSGGAIYFYESGGSVLNSIFINNYARDYGGCIMGMGRNISIANCTFKNNYARDYGGAIYFSRSFRNSVVNSTFIGNNASFGGGIYFKDKLNKAIVKNSLFKQNYAEYGAAISTSNQTTRNVVMDSIFIENKAKYDGVLYGINVQNCTIVKIQSQLSCKQLIASYNDDKYHIISLKGSDGVKISNVVVKIKYGGVVKSLITNNQGEVKFSAKNLVPKSYSVVISFLGNDIYDKTSINSKIVINKAKLKLIAKNKAFKSQIKTKKYTVVVKDKFGNAVKKTNLLLKIKGQKYKATPNKNGKATFKITKLNKKAKYNAKIIFKSNKYYNSVSKNVKINIV